LLFKSLWLGFSVRAYVEGLGSNIWFGGSSFSLQEATNCLPAWKPQQHLYMQVGLSCYRCHS